MCIKIYLSKCGDHRPCCCLLHDCTRNELFVQTHFMTSWWRHHILFTDTLYLLMLTWLIPLYNRSKIWRWKVRNWTHFGHIFDTFWHKYISSHDLVITPTNSFTTDWCNIVFLFCNFYNLKFDKNKNRSSKIVRIF